MKNGKLVILAQALDNVSPDPIEFNGKLLPDDDDEMRNVAASFVNTVTRNGEPVFDEDRVRLTAYEDAFVIVLPSVERDSRNRIAPILCYSSYNASEDEGFHDSIVDSLVDFAKKIERNIDPMHIKLMRESLLIFKKKTLKQKHTRVFTTLGIIVAVIVLLLLLVCVRFWKI